jgi:cell wall-associated NlpC family hydrolase
MRKYAIITVIGAVVFGAVMLTGIVRTAVSGVAAAQYLTQDLGCIASIGPIDPAQGNGASQASQLTTDQKAIVATIFSVGKQRNLPPLAWQVAIQAGMTESGLRNLNYGDRDSLGIFQMRPSMGWGTAAQLQDTTYEVNKFFDVLVNVPGWQTKRPGDAAQAVERSAFPDRYNKWEAMAVSLLGSAGQVVNATGCGQIQTVGNVNVLPAPTAAAQTAITFALAQLGKPYLWGAIGPDAYDCSGLTSTSYENAGIKISRHSSDQFSDGALLPVSQAQPGDLLFWAYTPSDPSTIHHVAIYLGNNQIVEAPQDNVPVRIRTVKWTEAQLVQEAVRPGV